jgi:hypothetical protein
VTHDLQPPYIYSADEMCPAVEQLMHTTAEEEVITSKGTHSKLTCNQHNSPIGCDLDANDRIGRFAMSHV